MADWRSTRMDKPSGYAGESRTGHRDASARRFDPSRPEAGGVRERRQGPAPSRYDPYTRQRRAAAAMEMRRNAGLVSRGKKRRGSFGGFFWGTNLSFVIVIAIAVTFLTVFSVYYIRTKAEYMSLMKKVAKKQTELSALEQENAAFENQVLSSVDSEAIRQIAIGRLGMKIPSEDQVQYYSLDEATGHVRQFQDIAEE